MGRKMKGSLTTVHRASLSCSGGKTPDPGGGAPENSNHPDVTLQKETNNPQAKQRREHHSVWRT